MELKLNREALCLNEVVYDGISEQSVEMDYILPDYYPDIFKILKCQLTPQVISYNTASDKLIYDVVVRIKVLYLAQESNQVKCIEQRYTYSKTLDLKKSCDNPLVTIVPKLDYCNCRAISERRLDIRGAVSCKVKVSCTGEQNIVSDACGLGVQTRKLQLGYAGSKIYTQKQFTIREEIELSDSKPSAFSILRHDAVANVSDFKIISNKIIIKGDAKVTMLYSASDEGDIDTLEATQAQIQLSQIVDLNGVSDEFECFVDMNVVTSDLTIKTDENGDSRIIACEIVICAICVAHKMTNVEVVSDAYSTEYSCRYSTIPLKTEMIPTIIDKTFMVKSSAEHNEGDINAVCDVWCSISNVVTRASSENEIIVSGTLNTCILAKSDEGPIYLEKSDIFDHSIDVDNLSRDSNFLPTVKVVSCSYSLASNNTVEIKAEVGIKGCLYEVKTVDGIDEITVDTNKPKERDLSYALKIYYADEGEGVWDIAKRYNTSVEAIMEENELEGEVLEQRGMLLIPIVG